MTMGKLVYTIKPSLVKDMTVSEVFSLAHRIETGGGAKKLGIDRDLGFAAQFVRNELRRYRFSPKGVGTKVEDFYRMRKIIDEDYIHIHRMSYVTYDVIQDFADWMDDRKMLTFSVKKYWTQAEKVFMEYQRKHRGMVEHCVWMTILDNMRMVYDLVRPCIEPLENAVRDYLIQKRQQIIDSGQKDDIALLSKVYVALMFCAALRNTRRNHFQRQYEQVGIDVSVDFAYADIDAVSRFFVRMMESVGIHFHKDNDGDDVPDGVDVGQSVRVESEWNKVVAIVTDADLMDETALDAINMNPETKKDYEAIMARSEAQAKAIKERQEKQELEEALDRLRQHQKVGSL